MYGMVSSNNKSKKRLQKNKSELKRTGIFFSELAL